MAQNTNLFVEKITPEIIAHAQQSGISCVYEGIPPFYEEKAASEGWVLPHVLIETVEETKDETDVL
jgi:hypothetical protein